MATETVNITTTLADDSVTNAQLANAPEATFKLRRVGLGTGDPEDRGANSAMDILDLASDPPVRTSVLPTVVEEDPGPGVGLIESSGVSPIVLKNLKDGLGTQVVSNTGSVQVDIDFTAADRYYYSDGSALPVEGTITSAGRDLLDDANAAAQRTTLGLGTAATANTGDFDAAGAAAAAQAASQPLDSDLTAIAGLTPSNDDVIQRKAGAWTNRSLAQLLSDFLFTTIGLAYARLTNPGAVTFPRQNADNTVTSRTAAELLTDLGMSREKVAISSFTSSSASFVDITGAAVTLDASSTYQFVCFYTYTSTTTTSGMNVSVTMTGSPTSRSLYRDQMSNGTGASASARIASDDAGTTAATTGSSATPICGRVMGTILTSGSACTVQMRFAAGGTAASMTIVSMSIVATKI